MGLCYLNRISTAFSIFGHSLYIIRNCQLFLVSLLLLNLDSRLQLSPHWCMSKLYISYFLHDTIHHLPRSYSFSSIHRPWQYALQPVVFIHNLLLGYPAFPLNDNAGIAVSVSKTFSLTGFSYKILLLLWCILPLHPPCYLVHIHISYLALLEAPTV